MCSGLGVDYRVPIRKKETCVSQLLTRADSLRAFASSVRSAQRSPPLTSAPAPECAKCRARSRPAKMATRELSRKYACMCVHQAVSAWGAQIHPVAKRCSCARSVGTVPSVLRTGARNEEMHRQTYSEMAIAIPLQCGRARFVQ